MNRLFVAAILALFSFISTARADLRAFECGQKIYTAKQSAELAEKVQDAYAKTKDFKGRFLQESFLAALDVSEMSSGEVWFQKPGRMKWHYEEPEDQTFVVRDTTLWLYQPADHQVSIDDFAHVLISDLPLAFILGVGDLTRDFIVQKGCENKEGAVLELAPKVKTGSKPKSTSDDETEGKPELKSFRLLVSLGSYLPQGALVSDVGGNRTAILFSQLAPNSGINDKEFEVHYPKGTDVVDHRAKKVP